MKKDQPKCKRDDKLYTSDPPQNRCKNCGRFWFVGTETPICEKLQPQEEKTEWELLKAEAVRIGKKEKWGKELAGILGIHLCYTNIRIKDPDQVLARSVLLIHNLLQKEREKAIRECVEIANASFRELHGGGNARRLVIQFKGKLQDLLEKK